jgi:hypothetical protein
VVYNKLVVTATCPYCHRFICIDDQLVLFYWCPACKHAFLPYKTPLKVGW